MFTVIIIMSVGMLIGAGLHTRKKYINLVEKITTYAIWLLLFLLGVSIGTNKTIVDNLGTLGVQAIFLSFSAIAGSVVLSYFVFIYFFKHER